MKTLKIFMILLISLGFSASAQDVYHVTRVNGTITNLGTGTNVIAGETLNPDDVLLFESLDSYAIAIGCKMGRFQIKIQDPAQANEHLTLTAMVKDAALPTKMRNLMLARFNPSEIQVSDLRQYFGNDKFSIIGDAVTIPLDQQKYSLSDDKFIVFYYRVDNNPVSKKIGHDEQSLILEKDKLVTSSAGSVQGNEISNLAVYEYQMSSRSSQEITRFTLVFVDKNELVSEFNTIIPILKRQKMANDDIKKYLIEYYYDFYGATDSKTIDTFADQIVKNY
ncbi:MAG: hypothetical protein PHD06_09965 [Bacteroidales bacterium]|jgi:hypothetical protein|nr:hypothetical protein [Bacteroidales bacterium]MDD4385486.1 hypothetical protein [Bacteroidales bacterium]MDY0198282.1 hypothetical protein [Tenuifilaceae bacterium]